MPRLEAADGTQITARVCPRPLFRSAAPGPAGRAIPLSLSEFPMSLDSLQTLFENELKDIYNAEKQLVTALPRMAKATTSPELRDAITKHLRETEGHVTRLERIFKSLDLPVRGKKCKGMEGLIEEGKEILEEDG